MSDRRSNAVILLIIAGLIAISAVLILSEKTHLGLDLKGGVQLTYKARPTSQAKVDSESLERAINIMRKRVDQLGVTQPEIQRTGEFEISVELPDVSNAARAEAEVGKTAQLLFYDWEPNVIGPSGEPAPKESSVTGGSAPGNSAFGLTEYKAVLRAEKRKPILRKSDTTWTAPSKGTHGCTPAQVNGCLYGSWYLLEPKHEKVICGPEETKANLYSDACKPKAGVKTRAVRINPGTVLAQALPEEERTTGKVNNPSPNSYYVLNDNPVLEGSSITNPAQGNEEQSGRPDVTFDFNSHGKKVFERVTKEIAQRGQDAQLPGVSHEQALQHFAITLDGQLITTPSIDYRQYPEGIDASTGSQISGGFTITSAQELAEELQSGALPVKLELISQSQVSATLGKTALQQGLKAGLVGLLVVCLFLLVFYRVLGVIAIGGLAIYGVYYFALIRAIPITLTLPGIAGTILTIGIAADANIVIFERVKEEIRAGRSIVAGISAGYQRGFAAIVDANIVTFMTAFILFALATAEVKGFAFTLGIGTLLTLFTAVLATRAMLGTMGHSRVLATRAALGAAHAKRALNFDFMGASKWFFSLSGTILLVGALAIGGKGLNFGIDFKSGTRIQTAFVEPVTATQLQRLLAKDGYSDAEVQKYTSKGVGGSGFQISLKELRPEQVRKVKADLDASFAKGSELGTKNFSSTSIGPTFGKTVAKSAIIAIIASLLVISVFIALRFEWKYAVPVLIALMHDLLITAGVYSLTGREVTSATVAALLTILGYSLYDTIIVFDRVRENVPRMPRAAFSQIVNRSMSEVLTRSLATSLCTLLPVLALLLFGGATLKDFAFALLVGIASGAYSSIFIASPVLTHWKEREPAYSNRRRRITSELGSVPAYATATGGAPVDVEPTKPRGRNVSIFGSSPDTGADPGEQISKREFQELVADLDVEKGTGSKVKRSQRATIEHDEPAAEQKPPADPTADLNPEDLVLKDPPKPRRPRNRRHGRSR